ncbi:hypothetical protein LEAN103870_02165 [Legionella anisa]|nr:hypothetical protein Lani_1673 [Legionella anisa]
MGCIVVLQWSEQQNAAVPDATAVKYTIRQSCKTFLANDSRYDCNADFPSAAN